jgi:Xaa-Pro aminopeptidase
MTTLLLYGDTARHASMRHEVPLEIVDPFLFVEHEGQALVLTNQLEQARIAEVLPGAHVVLVDELGLHDLVADGMPRPDANLEVIVRALAQWGVEAALVAPDLPVAVADRVRAAGVELTVDRLTLDGRRRVKSDAELLGIRRAQRAAEAGMAVAERLIRGAEPVHGRLHRDGRELTAEMVRDAVRAACAALGAPAPPNIMVASALSGGGHDPGSGPLPADLPITVDLWPRDEDSSCWADMTRTFVRGEIGADVTAVAGVVRAALEAVRAAARPGIAGESCTPSRPRSSRTAASGRSARASAARRSRTASGSRSVTASGSTSTKPPASVSAATTPSSPATSSRSSPASSVSNASAASASRISCSSRRTAARR